MSKNSMFIRNPDDSEGYLINLAGVVLICGDTVFGNPTETTPEGRTNAMRMVERTLQESEKRGFKHSSTVWALMRRNDASPRLVNLAQQAVDLIPKDLQSQIIQEELSNARNRASTQPLVMATKHPGRHEPETNPRLLRPGPDGVDPRFWKAGRELQRIADTEGSEAIQKPEHSRLYADMLRFAPKDIRDQMEAKIREMNLIPEATHVGEDGQPIFSMQQIAEKLGVSEAEVVQLVAQSGIDREDLYDGPAFPLPPRAT